MSTVVKEFEYTGTLQIANLPIGVASIDIYLWGGAGGSGVVIVRFPGSTCASVAPGTNTLSSCVGSCNEKVARFTVSGTLTIS